jgi:ribose/xylose/arabinose/galactoside ABC-type transport system permease subunit
MSALQNNSSLSKANTTLESNLIKAQIVHQLKQMSQVLIGLFVIYSTFWLLAPDFRNIDTLLTILTQASVLGILACGTTIVLISGGLDLSVGSIFAVVGVVVGICLSIYELPVWIAVIIGLSTGALCGFINGFIQVSTGVPAFIVTLGGLTAYKGLAEILANGKDLSQFPESFHVFGSGYFVPTLIMFACALIVGIFLRKTRMGSHAYAIGGNEEIARLSGVNVTKSRIVYYMIGGVMAAIAAIIQISRLDFAQSSRGVSYELFAIAAVVIGGTSLFGGRGGVSRTIVGILIMQTIIVGLAYLGVGTSFQRIAMGVIIVLAVWLDVWKSKKR